MPAFLAHYSCGVLAKHHIFDQRLNQSDITVLHRAIREHPQVFHVALAGPDLFFYSPLELLSKGMKLGRAMHKYRTGMFLRSLYDEALLLPEEEREIGLAYVAGFVGHYCLDASEHPIIYRMCDDAVSKKALGKHFRFEAAMDVRCLKHFFGRDMNQSYQMGMIQMDRRERSIASRILSNAIRKVYPDARTFTGKLRMDLLFRQYVCITALLTDPTGIKEWLFLGMEKLFRSYPVYSPLFLNDHIYGTTYDEWRRFYRRFARGERYFEKLLLLMDEALEESENTEKKETFFAAVGTRCYHTGRHEDGAKTEIDWE